MRPGFKVDAALPRTTVHGKLVVCDLFVFGKPCWTRRGHPKSRWCQKCFLIGELAELEAKLAAAEKKQKEEVGDANQS